MGQSSLSSVIMSHDVNTGVDKAAMHSQVRRFIERYFISIYIFCFYFLYPYLIVALSLRGDIAVYPRRASPDAYLSVLLKQMFSLGLSLFMLWALALERRASLLSVLVCGNIVPQRLLSLCRSCTPPYLMVSLRADLHAGHTSAASVFLRKCAAGPYRPHTDVVN